MNELERATLMLSVASDAIKKIAGDYVQIGMASIDDILQVQIFESAAFDKAAKGVGVNVSIEKSDDGCMFPYRHSFMLHGIEFVNLREVGVIGAGGDDGCSDVSFFLESKK